MEFRYQIPEHLKGFIGDMPEPQLSALMTMLFEYAIQHRMIDYPRTEIEDSVDEIRRVCNEIKTKQSLENSIILQMVTSMNAQITAIQMAMAGGQMPTIPMAYPQFAPMYMPQAAPTQEQGQQAPKVNDIKISEEVYKGDLQSSDDETLSDFEGEVFV